MSGELQYSIKFNNGSTNLFRQNLESGAFTVLIETSVPEKTVSGAAAVEKLRELENAVVNNQSGIYAALAISDRRDENNLDLRAVEYAASLPENNRSRHVVYLSGADTNVDKIEELVDFAAEHGLCNLVAVSGEANCDWSGRECKKHPFTESICTLQKAASTGGFFLGAGVNPYQYTFYTLFGQYFKLMKKIGQGAAFAVTQAGWDMLKLQSLMWYLRNRQVFLPVISRLILLSPAQVEKINAGKCPGVKISKDFNRYLSRELRYSQNQFDAAQYRRIELQAAGCRLLGMSGVQIAGVDTPARARFIIARISAALKEFTSFEQWISEYHDYMASAEMAPFSNDFKLFDPILRRDYPVDSAPVRHSEFEVEQVSVIDRWRFKLRRMLFKHADKSKAGKKFLLKLFSVGCSGCGRCRLPQTQYICPERCPKHLADGVCGDVDPNGNCAITGSECIQVGILKKAYQNNEYAEVESSVTGQADR